MDSIEDNVSTLYSGTSNIDLSTISHITEVDYNATQERSANTVQTKTSDALTPQTIAVTTPISLDVCVPLRQYPTKKKEKPYPNRYDSAVFEKLNEMNEDTELRKEYKKWKVGINYKTNRKITMGKKLHEELRRKFMIYTACGDVLFDTLNSINADEYLQETNIINSEIDVENAIVKDYNKLVDGVIEKIQKLEKWNDFIEFEGNYYGITSKVLNNIHIEHDCFGQMIFTRKETEFSFNDRPFCNYDDKETTYSIYKCSKCIYETKMYECSTGGGSQYVSKCGFWWK